MMKRNPLVFCLALLMVAGAGVWRASAAPNVVFLETMATNAVKPWTGTGCDNAWTVTFSGGNPFEQATGWNYGSGNPCGMQFKQGTANLAENMITATQGIAANRSAAYVEFYLWADGLSGSAGWTFQLDAGAGYVTRLSELTGANHGYQLYHYDLQTSELVGNLTPSRSPVAPSHGDHISAVAAKRTLPSGGARPKRAPVGSASALLPEISLHLPTTPRAGPTTSSRLPA